MKRWIVYLLIISLSVNLLFMIKEFFVYPQTAPVYHPFDVNFAVTEQSLLENGYEPIPEDVYILGKRRGDTLLYYQLDQDCEPVDEAERDDPIEMKCEEVEVFWRNYQITLDKLDTLAIEQFIEKNDGFILSDWQSNNKSYYIKQFLVKYKYSGVLFRCTIYYNSDKNKYVFSAECDFPIMDRRKMLERKAKLEKNAS